jgi:uncharacterized protein
LGIIFVYTLIMFSWDTKKASVNLEKHGVSFEEAASVFLDPEGLDFETETHELSEQRNIRLGVSVSGKILVVVYTVRILQNAKETIRIISGRQASRKERKAYTRFSD